VRSLTDLKGMRVRLMPGKIHHRSFELMGTIPFSLDLKPGLEAIVSGSVDAQENPLANTVDYGAHKVHRYHTLTGHCYLSRGIYMNRAQFDSWPEALRDAIKKAASVAVLAQRELAVEEENVAQKVIEATGGEVLELAAKERQAFIRTVRPLHDEARKQFGDEVFDLVPAA